MNFVDRSWLARKAPTAPLLLREVSSGDQRKASGETDPRAEPPPRLGISPTNPPIERIFHDTASLLPMPCLISNKEAFMKLSTKLNKLFPSNNDFLNNIGSYYLVNSDFKSALKIFSKVLKKQPDNLTAIQNSVLASRFMKDSKSEIKYLQMMVKYAPQREALLAKSRMEALTKK
jgi:tetratricopeptide (TPR) repeat protein